MAALQRERLDYLFQAAALVRRDWPYMRPGDTCVLLIEAHVQWVVNCDSAPRGFAASSDQMHGRPIFVHEGGSFEEGQGQSRTTAELLAVTPAAAQVRGSAHAHAGLPGSGPWLVLGSLEALTEFHPAFAHATTEAWVSVAIHEFVHTHQLQAPSAQPLVDAIVSLTRTPAALTTYYARHAGYRALVKREYQLLTRAARTDPADRTAARRALTGWLKLLRRRVASLRAVPNADALIEDDALFAYLEGVARFVESEFLAQPRYHPERPALAGDRRFQHYRLFLGEGYAGSPNRQLDEHYFYAIGYHLCVLLDRLDTDWRSRLHTEDRWLYSVVEQVAGSHE